MPSANRNSFHSSLYVNILFLFIIFIALARTHNAVLNKSGESGHPCLVSDHREKAFNFLLLSMMLAGGFPGVSDSKESACNGGDPGSIPGWGRFPGEGNGYPLHYYCLENFMDRGA